MNRFFKILYRNPLQKIIALIIAIGVWIYVNHSQNPTIEESYSVPLTIDKTSTKFFADSDIKMINLKVKAPRSKFLEYDSAYFRAYVNVDNLDIGYHNIIPEIVMPRDFELIETNPKEVTVKVEPIIEKQMAIKINTSGELGSDTLLQALNKSMEYATLVGPKSFIDQVNNIFGIVYFKGNTSSFDVPVPLKAVDLNGNVVSNIQIAPSTINVTAEILSGIKRRVVPIIAELSASDGWELQNIIVDPTQIEISGEESIVNSIDKLKTVPITVQNGQSNFRSSLKVVVPDGIHISNTEVTVSADLVQK